MRIVWFLWLSAAVYNTQKFEMFTKILPPPNSQCDISYRITSGCTNCWSIPVSSIPSLMFKKLPSNVEIIVQH